MKFIPLFAVVVSLAGCQFNINNPKVNADTSINATANTAIDATANTQIAAPVATSQPTATPSPSPTVLETTPTPSPTPKPGYFSGRYSKFYGLTPMHLTATQVTYSAKWQGAGSLKMQLVKANADGTPGGDPKVIVEGNGPGQALGVVTVPMDGYYLLQVVEAGGAWEITFDGVEK